MPRRRLSRYRKYDPSGHEAWTFALGACSAAGSVFGLATDTTGVYAIRSTRSEAYVAKIGPLPSFASVSAAHYINDSSLAPASIAGGFGESLAETTVAAGSVPCR
jgi:hypothetical protein